MIQIPKKLNTLNSKIIEKIWKEHGKPNPDESCTDKYQKPIAYSYPFK